MKKENLIFAGLIMVIVISIILIFLLLDQNFKLTGLLESEKTPQAGDEAFVFSRKTINDGLINIKNKKTLLVFFNTRCPACKKYLPVIQNEYEGLVSKGINVLGISYDSIQEIEKYITKQKILFPIILDPGKEIFKKYGVRGVVFLVLIDKNKIAYYHQYIGVLF